MFINEFITIGIVDFFERQTYSFERHIIECMCDIYGKDNINALYNNKDQNGFIRLIRSFGYSENSYLRFLGFTSEYEAFKKSLSSNPNLKTDVYNKIESEVITMFGFKFLLEKAGIEEINSFENNLLNDFETTRLKMNTGTNQNFTKELWHKRKVEFKNSINLFSVRVDYLDDETYKKFNLDLDTVKQMDYRMVEKLNESIIERLKHPEEIVEEEAPKSKFVLSSGNGFVDILIMISIITTILSAGVVYIILR